jgi:hypothetical protein
MKLWKDTLIGAIAGLVAAAVLLFRHTEVQIPAGIYQAQFDQAKYREVTETLRGPAVASATQQKLQKPLRDVQARDVPFENALAYISELSGVSIRADWGVLDAARVPRDLAISLEMHNASASAVLREALNSAGRLGTRLAYQVEGDHVRVSTYDVLNKEVLTRAYDVRDIIRGLVERDHALLMPASIPPGIDAQKLAREGPYPFFENLGEGGVHPLWKAWNLRFADFVTSPASALTTLIKLLQDNIDPKSWRDAGGELGSIRYFGGKLIINQSRQNQEEVAMWLEWLREEIKR